MSALLNSFLDFFLPRTCYNCGNKLTADEILFCAECQPEITIVSPERLRREFDRKFAADKIISGFQSYFVFETEGAVQEVIHEMKYRNSFIMGKTLGQITAAGLYNNIIVWNADLIIPVPIHRLRRADRGYNQSLYIAKGISTALNIPLKPHIIRRARYTATQTALNLSERKQNVKDAFVLRHSRIIKEKRIILVDDVITTGATITECGKVLLDNGAEKVFAMSVALAE